MIKGLAQMGRYTYVQGGNANLPYVSPNSNIPFTGVMRVNGTEVEVFNGSNWVMINSSYASVGLTPEAESLLDWAKQKRDKEMQIQALAEKHPGIKDLQDKLDIMLALVKENDAA